MSGMEDASVSLETLGFHTWWMKGLLSMETAVIHHWGALCAPPGSTLLNQSPSSFSTRAANHLPSSHISSCSCL